MIERFQGKQGLSVLIEALLKQQVVGQNRELAKAIAQRAQLEEFRDGTELIRQGGTDNDLYLILSGATEVMVNGRAVAKRATGYACGRDVNHRSDRQTMRFSGCFRRYSRCANL